MEFVPSWLLEVLSPEIVEVSLSLLGVHHPCMDTRPPTLSDPMDCSLPGSSVHGIFQARVLEWGAIAIGVDGLESSTQF